MRPRGSMLSMPDSNALWARAAGDHRLGPLPDRFVFLAPVVLAGIPRARVLEPQRYEAESTAHRATSE